MEIEELKNLIKDPTKPGDFQIIRDEAEQRIASGTTQDNLEMMDYLSDIISNYGSALSARLPQAYDSYQALWTLAGFAGFIGLQSAVQESLLQKSIFFAITKGLNTDSLLQQFYNFYESDDFIKETFRILLNSLQQNTEVLGANSIETEGKKFLPQIRYWIMDYSKFPTKAAARTAVERLNYINQSPNCRQLTQVQRQSLLSLLKLYDDFIKAQPPVSEKQQVAGRDYASENLAQPPQQQAAQLASTDSALSDMPLPPPPPPPVRVQQVQVQKEKLASPMRPAPEQKKPQAQGAPLAVDIKQKEIGTSIPAYPAELMTELAGSKAAQPISGQAVRQPQQSLSQPPQPSSPSLPTPQKQFQQQKEHKITREPVREITINVPEDLAMLAPDILHNSSPRPILRKIYEIAAEMSNGGKYLSVIYNIEQSQLYRTYVSLGIALLNDPTKSRDDIFIRYIDEARNKSETYLTKDEFEAFTDFRKELDKLAV